MTANDKVKFTALQQQLRDGIAAVHDEHGEAERDTRAISALHASVHERLGRTHPDSPEADQLIADLARLEIARVWQAQRINREIAIKERLVSIIRCAGCAVADFTITQPNWTGQLSTDTATVRASEAIEDLETRINYVAPPEQPAEEGRWFTALSPRIAA